MCILWALILDFGFTLKKQKEKNQKKKKTNQDMKIIWEELETRSGARYN